MTDINKNPYFFDSISEDKKEIPLQVYEKQPDLTSEEIPHTKIEGLTSIIIPSYFINYPVFHYTGHCIGSIREHTDREKTPYEIIFVINGYSGKEFKDLFQTNCEKVITNEKNMGYAYAVNQGIRTSRGEYIAIVNNDVMVFDYWLEDMQDALKHIDLVMATPMYGKPYARAVEAKMFRVRTLNKPIKETFTNFRDFSCVCAKRSLFEEIGLLNEQFFVYKEDLDFFNSMDKSGKKYASTGNPDTNARINIFHIIGATSVNMSEQQTYKKEGEDIYNKLWKK